MQREGKIGYSEAQVVELDFDSTVRRVKFTFYRLSNDRDEWVEVGSPRIAPHVSPRCFLLLSALFACAKIFFINALVTLLFSILTPHGRSLEERRERSTKYNRREKPSIQNHRLRLIQKH